MNNLLSEGIINADGTPGMNSAQATQYRASDTDTFHVAPTKTGAFTTLPPLTAGGPKDNSDTSPPFNTYAQAQNATSDLYPREFENAAHRGNWTFLWRARHPVGERHCDLSHASATNPSGCLNDLFPWVEITIGAGTNGAPLTPGGITPSGEGSVAMGIYNVAEGDMPYFKQLSDNYTISDNYHQPAKGGTGLDSIMAGFGDAIYYTDGKGNASTPPAGQIENPNPKSGTNNVYINDGYGNSTTGEGGSYSNCADASQPGVKPILDYLAALPEKPNPNCDPDHYYLLNNYNPGYLQDGTVDTTTFTIPPTSQASIGDVLLANAVSFAWFGEGWNQAAADPASPDNVYFRSLRARAYARSCPIADAAVIDRSPSVADGGVSAVSAGPREFS